jgi:hypothetical protein
MDGGDGWRRGHRGGSDDPVFCTVSGQRLAGSYLSRLARKAEAAGLVGRFTGHSFRIGSAAFMASLPNVTLQEVQSAGGWRSDAVLRYLRNVTVVTAAKDLSAQAGL